MKSIAIITARGGSKRIPRKNVKPFLGQPIIHYSIDAALQSGIFDEVMVTTDDEEIASISKERGANIPFMRSERTSDDFSTTADVLIEVLDKYRSLGKEFNYACCIYPTAPFVTPQKLKHAFSMLVEQGADSVMPVSKYSVPIWWAMEKKQDFVSLHWPENANKRSQDLPVSFYDCGQFYFFDVPKFLESKKLFTDNTLGLEIPETEVQDIDVEEDWAIAEVKYTWLKRKLGDGL